MSYKLAAQSDYSWRDFLRRSGLGFMAFLANMRLALKFPGGQITLLER